MYYHDYKKQESYTCTFVCVCIRKVLFSLAPYSMCESAACYCSCVNFMQVAPAWFFSAEQSQQNCKYFIIPYMFYMYLKVFIGCGINEMRVLLLNLTKSP